MQWLDQLPFADNRVVQIGFLAACGIAALIVLAIIYRLAFAHRLRVPGGRTRQPRLGLVDAFSLDGQRQLVLVRRDNVEHLVMIGGPNDVLVESQINRALTPARENNQASPLLAPGTPSRRTETAVAAAPVVAEAPPAKVAAPAPSPPLASPKAPAPPSPPPAAAPAAPKAPAPSPPPAAAPAAAKAPPAIAAPPVPVPPAPKAPAPSPATVAAPAAKPIEPEPAARPPVAPPAPPSAEPARPAPSSSPPSRSGMPPPIVPASASPNRGTVTRLTERVPPRPSQLAGNAPASSPAAPPRPEKADAAAATATLEPRPTPLGAAASAAPAQARPAAKTVTPAPAYDGAQKPGEARALGEKANGASSVKPPTKVDDPFADLDSLEAEMARLLGRDKLN